MSKSFSKKGIIALCSLVYFVSYFSRKDFAAAMVGMISSSVLDKPSAGLMGTFMFIFYGIGQLLSGYLGDKFKPQYIILTGLSTTAVCNILLPFIPAYAMVPIWGLNGLAQAMLWPPIVKILSEYLDHETYVKANFLVTSAAHVATILLYIFVPVCLNIWSWQTVFFTAGALVVVSIAVFILALALVLPRDVQKQLISANKSSGRTDNERSFSKVMIASGIIPILGAIIASGFLRDGIESWLPTLYSEVFGRDASESVLVSVVLPIFSIASIYTVTAFHKKKLFNNELRGAIILFIACIALCVPLAVLINLKAMAARFICLILVALVCAGMHGINFLLISCLPGRFSSLGRSSSVGGLVNAFVYVGAACSMYGIALISDNLGWLATAISWIIISAVGAVLSAVAYRKYTAFISDPSQKTV